MPKRLDRRRFLSNGTGALFASMLAKPVWATPGGIAPAPTPPATPPIPPKVPAAPVARVEVVKDTYFGETLSDPYRWMENSNDSGWLPFLKGQNDHARAILDALPSRAGFLKRITQLTGDTALTNRVQRAGGLTFYQQRTVGADNFKLFVRDADGHDRALVDPTQLSGPKSHLSLDWWRASPDGRLVVYGLSKDGSEDSLLHILKVADGQDLPDRIPDTQDAHPEWLDDSSGFFYTQLTGKVDTPERFLDAQARFHRVGADPQSDPILMKRGLVPGIEYDKIQMPSISTFRGARHAILTLSDVRPEFRAYIAPLSDVIAGHAKWTHIAAFDDVLTDVDLHGDDLFLLVNKTTPRGELRKTSVAAPKLATAAVLVPQGAAVIESLSRAKDGLYFLIQDGGVNRLRRFVPGAKVKEIALPFDGAIGGPFANPEEDGVFMSFTGWLSPAALYQVNAAGVLTDTGITPKPNIDVSAYEAKRSFCVAKDGVKIPYTLIYRKGLKLDGSAPTWISAYGSYGITPYMPTFAGKTLALVDAGFVVGYANVRGGGEYGREWHKAGQLENKPNTWHDLIAVCEELIAKKYTSTPHLAIGGRSAGGITVGRALTERPDLFAAVIDGVGWSNPLRYVAEQNGYGEEPEWGAIADAAGYRALKSIDSYQAVKDGTPYPAVLLTTGVTDPRVAPFHVAKMTARLQAATSSGKPILLRVDYDAGHGIGSTRAQQDREAADTYAFLQWQLTGATANRAGKS
jgi:prolyl oligopeptidase